MASQQHVRSGPAQPEMEPMPTQTKKTQRQGSKDACRKNKQGQTTAESDNLPKAAQEGETVMEEDECTESDGGTLSSSMSDTDMDSDSDEEFSVRKRRRVNPSVKKAVVRRAASVKSTVTGEQRKGTGKSQRFTGMVHQLGMYDTEESAAQAWDRVAWVYRGDQEALNFPDMIQDYDSELSQARVHELMDERMAMYKPRGKSAHVAKSHKASSIHSPKRTGRGGAPRKIPNQYIPSVLTSEDIPSTSRDASPSLGPPAAAAAPAAPSPSRVRPSASPGRAGRATRLGSVASAPTEDTRTESELGTHEQPSVALPSVTEAVGVQSERGDGMHSEPDMEGDAVAQVEVTLNQSRPKRARKPPTLFRFTDFEQTASDATVDADEKPASVTAVKSRAKKQPPLSSQPQPQPVLPQQGRRGGRSRKPPKAAVNNEAEPMRVDAKDALQSVKEKEAHEGLMMMLSSPSKSKAHVKASHVRDAVAPEAAAGARASTQLDVPAVSDTARHLPSPLKARVKSDDAVAESKTDQSMPYMPMPPPHLGSLAHSLPSLQGIGMLPLPPPPGLMYPFHGPPFQPPPMPGLTLVRASNGSRSSGQGRSGSGKAAFEQLPAHRLSYPGSLPGSRPAQPLQKFDMNSNKPPVVDDQDAAGDRLREEDDDVVMVHDHRTADDSVATDDVDLDSIAAAQAIRKLQSPQGHSEKPHNIRRPDVQAQHVSKSSKKLNKQLFSPKDVSAMKTGYIQDVQISTSVQTAPVSSLIRRKMSDLSNAKSGGSYDGLPRTGSEALGAELLGVFAQRARMEARQRSSNQKGCDTREDMVTGEDGAYNKVRTCNDHQPQQQQQHERVDGQENKLSQRQSRLYKLAGRAQSSSSASDTHPSATEHDAPDSVADNNQPVQAHPRASVTSSQAPAVLGMDAKLQEILSSRPTAQINNAAGAAQQDRSQLKLLQFLDSREKPLGSVGLNDVDAMQGTAEVPKKKNQIAPAATGKAATTVLKVQKAPMTSAHVVFSSDLYGSVDGGGVALPSVFHSQPPLLSMTSQTEQISGSKYPPITTSSGAHQADMWSNMYKQQPGPHALRPANDQLHMIGQESQDVIGGGCNLQRQDSVQSQQSVQLKVVALQQDALAQMRVLKWDHVFASKSQTYRGVYQQVQSEGGHWAAVMEHGGQLLQISVHDQPEEAACAYDYIVVLFNGSKNYLNFPQSEAMIRNNIYNHARALHAPTSLTSLQAAAVPGYSYQKTADVQQRLPSRDMEVAPLVVAPLQNTSSNGACNAAYGKQQRGIQYSTSVPVSAGVSQMAEHWKLQQQNQNLHGSVSVPVPPPPPSPSHASKSIRAQQLTPSSTTAAPTTITTGAAFPPASVPLAAYAPRTAQTTSIMAALQAAAIDGRLPKAHSQPQKSSGASRGQTANTAASGGGGGGGGRLAMPHSGSNSGATGAPVVASPSSVSRAEADAAAAIVAAAAAASAGVNRSCTGMPAPTARSQPGTAATNNLLSPEDNMQFQEHHQQNNNDRHDLPAWAVSSVTGAEAAGIYGAPPSPFTSQCANAQQQQQQQQQHGSGGMTNTTTTPAPGKKQQLNDSYTPWSKLSPLNVDLAASMFSPIGSLSALKTPASAAFLTGSPFSGGARAAERASNGGAHKYSQIAAPVSAPFAGQHVGSEGFLTQQADPYHHQPSLHRNETYSAMPFGSTPVILGSNIQAVSSHDASGTVRNMEAARRFPTVLSTWQQSGLESRSQSRGNDKYPVMTKLQQHSSAPVSGPATRQGMMSTAAAGIVNAVMTVAGPAPSSSSQPEPDAGMSDHAAMFATPAAVKRATSSQDIISGRSPCMDSIMKLLVSPCLPDDSQDMQAGVGDALLQQHAHEQAGNANR